MVVSRQNATLEVLGEKARRGGQEVSVMRALVVFESMFGNTRAVAEAVAQGLGSGCASGCLPWSATVRSPRPPSTPGSIIRGFPALPRGPRRGG